MTLHSNKRRPTPDRRGGKFAQPKPKLSPKHTHVMVPWGSDTRYQRCDQAGCPYAEVDGKPARGPKERCHEYAPAELFPESFA